MNETPLHQIYQALQLWRVQLYGHLPQIEAEVLRQIRSDLEQTITSITAELIQRSVPEQVPAPEQRHCFTTIYSNYLRVVHIRALRFGTRAYLIRSPRVRCRSQSPP